MDDEYGIDPEGPVSSTENSVSIPASSLNFSDSDISTLQTNVDPLTASDNYGIDLYERALTLISGFTPV